MTVIEIIEHQKLKIGKKFDPDSKQITKQDADFLRKLELKHEKSIFKWGHNTISPQQWVGVIAIPSGTVEVLPKIAEHSNIERLREIMVHMLQVVHNVSVRKYITANLRYGTQGFLDVLIYLFLTELEKQLKNGIYKTYQKHTQNLNSIKGTVDHPENLRKNALLKNKFVCRYSKFTENNLLNQIIKFTLEHLSKVAVTQRNKVLIKKLAVNFDGVTLKRINESDIDSLVLHRNNLRFKETINFCRLFLKGLALNLKSGEVMIEFMLFDMNQLFEKYIYQMFKKALKNANVVYQYKKNYMLTETTSATNRIQLKPDLIITTQNKTIVVDTKWKNMRGFADEKDIYQMNAYLGCIPKLYEGILLYPKSTKNDKIVDDYIIKGTNNTGSIKIRTVDLSLSGQSPAFLNYLIGLLN
jgi:5-methylcytosine-specific restriction enzyme subunit McrC